MKVTNLTPRAFEFACYSKACAPPPAGAGGSTKGGGKSHGGHGTPAKTILRANKPPRTDYRNSPRTITGRPVTGPKKPLYNPTTGRLNPLPVRRAFQQGDKIGRKEDSKRTTVSPSGVRTVGTYKGRVIKHISSKGGKSGRKKFVNPLSGNYVR